MLFFIFSFISVFLWYTLYTWFPFSAHDKIPYAFYKIVGQSDLNTIENTLRIFVFLTCIYYINYFILRKESSLSSYTKFIFPISIFGSIIFAILLYPIGSRDFFNYLIQLKLTYFYHINPYTSSFQPFRSDPFAGFGFSLFIPLFYGPAWLFFSGIPALFANFTNLLTTALIFKIFNALLVVATGLIIFLYQDTKKKKFLALYLFLANPFILFEGIVNAHNDIMMAFFLVLALFCLKKKSIIAIPFFITAILIKFFVLALAPIFIGALIRKKILSKRIALSLIISLFTISLYFMLFWQKGEMLKGLSKGIALSQSYIMDQASLLSFTREYFIHNHINDAGIFSSRNGNLGTFLLSSLLIFILWVKRKISDEVAMQDTFMLFLLFVSLLYPWYLLPVITLMTLTNKNIAQLFLFTFIYFLNLPLGTLLLNFGYTGWDLRWIQTFLLSGSIIFYFLVKIFSNLRSRNLPMVFQTKRAKNYD